MSRISVVGTGYVGLIQAVGLAKLGKQVTCVDSNHEKIGNLKAGIAPIYEDGLADLLNQTKDNIRYVADLSEVRDSEAVFICVGTPQDESGKTDLSQIRKVSNELSGQLSGNEIIVLKSTVPIGTNRMVSELLGGKNPVVSNPEFLREGLAIKDFFNPDRVVIGTDPEMNGGDAVRMRMRAIYSEFEKNGVPFIETDWQTAELIKYSANSFLATKISYMNMIARLCDATGANVRDVMQGMGMDPRIGKQFLNAGIGYGGSCFPKDVKSLIHQFEESGIEPSILHGTDHTNETQAAYFLGRILSKLGSVEGKRIGVVGVAFKPDTDDIRESRGVEIIELLAKKGASIRYFDYNSKAMENFSEYLGGRWKNANYDISCEPVNSFSELSETEALVIACEDKRILAENLIETLSGSQVKYVFDGRNLADASVIESLGIQYVGVGVGTTGHNR